MSSVVACGDYWAECDGGSLVPSREVSSMVVAFASSRGVPSVAPDDTGDQPHCARSEAHHPTEGPPGLRVDFLEPGVVGDSARVVVMTRCQAPGRLMAKFSQGHEFIFRRGPDGTRALTKRQLVFVS